jgi:hypothetical protein
MHRRRAMILSFFASCAVVVAVWHGLPVEPADRLAFTPYATQPVAQPRRDAVEKRAAGTLSHVAPQRESAPTASDDDSPPAGLHIAGVLVVDGTAPPEPVTVTLIDQREPPPPDDVLRELGLNWITWRRTSQRSRAGGAFDFGGLPAGFRARIELPDGYRILATSVRATEVIDAGGAPVLIQATRIPVITGRVVDRESKVPFGGIAFGASLPPVVQHSGLSVDDDGRFTVEVGDARIERALLAFDLGRGVRHSIAVEGPFLVSRDIGDIEVESASRTVVLRVVDHDGRPVPSAVGYVPQTAIRSPPTDDQGEARIDEVPRSVSVLAAVALGFAPGESEIDASGQASVRLRRVTDVTFAIQPWPPPFAGDVMIVLSGEIADFVMKSVDVQNAESVNRASVFGSGMVAEKAARQLLRTADGVGRASGLPAGVRICCELFDSLGAAVSTPFFFTLGTGERRRIEVPIAEGGRRTVAGIVTDETGRPLENASVDLGSDGHDGLTQSTGASGEFRFEGVHAERAHVRIFCDGFRALDQANEPLTSAMRFELRRREK